VVTTEAAVHVIFFRLAPNRSHAENGHDTISSTQSMKQFGILFILIVIVTNAHGLSEQVKNLRVSFDGVEYFHRQSANGQHRFTPKGQEDLLSWKNMLTVIDLPQATSIEKLLELAGDLPSPYRNLGDIIGGDIAPAIGSTPEAFALVFERERLNADSSDFVTVEYSIAKIYMSGRTGVLAIYSHRAYDADCVDRFQARIPENMVSATKALRIWDSEQTRELLQ